MVVWGIHIIIRGIHCSLLIIIWGMEDDKAKWKHLNLQTTNMARKVMMKAIVVDDKISLGDTPDDLLTVQVLNMTECNMPGHAYPIGFDEALHSLKVLTVVMEKNPSGEAVMKKSFGNLGDVKDEFFIKFKTKEDAFYALVMRRVDVRVNTRSGRTLEFVKPAKNQATRAAYRRIYELKARLPAIGMEYNSMHVERPNADKPTLPGHFVDKESLKSHVSEMQKKRKTGIDLDHHEMQFLRIIKVVDTKSLRARIDELYNEEQDAWLELRKYQTMDGLVFDV